jgi:hypothetical protein
MRWPWVPLRYSREMAEHAGRHQVRQVFCVTDLTIPYHATFNSLPMEKSTVS